MRATASSRSALAYGSADRCPLYRFEYLPRAVQGGGYAPEADHDSAKVYVARSARKDPLAAIQRTPCRPESIRLMRHPFALTILCGPLLILACEKDRSGTALMTRVDSGVCEKAKGAPVLELPASGGYQLDHKPQTRHQVEAWFANEFPRGSTGEPRMVIVRPDSRRRSELAWIIQMVNTAGAEVVSPKFPCPFELEAPAT
jgi:hypothetical protein